MRPERASLDVVYKDSILPEDEPQLCPAECIMRYMYDKDNWIEVYVGERGIELRSNGSRMLVTPHSGNTIEVFMRDRK